MTPAEARTGFGIPFLMRDVQEMIDKGVSKDDAIELVADRSELRSEAIEVLRIALSAGEAAPGYSGDRQ